MSDVCGTAVSRRRWMPVLFVVVVSLLGITGAGQPAAGEPRQGAERPREVVFVANAEGGTVSIIDARSLKVVDEIDVLPDGEDASADEDDPFHALLGQRLIETAGGDNFAQDLDLSPDGRTLYVSRGHRGDVAAFDIRTEEMLWKTTIAGLRADHMTISADGRFLYVSALTDDIVEVVDTERGEVVDSFPTGEWPHDNHVSADGQRLYNASIGNIVTPWDVRAARASASTPILGEPYQLTVVDADSLDQIETHTFERGIRPFVITHDETLMYAQLSEFHGVVEYDLEAGRILRTLDLPIDEGVTEDDYDFEAPHHGLAISPDGSLLCAAGRASDYAALISTDTLSPVAITDVGDAPSWATNDPQGRHCYLANNRDNTVSIISYASHREIARMPVGDGPKYLVAGRIPVDALPPKT